MKLSELSYAMVLFCCVLLGTMLAGTSASADCISLRRGAVWMERAAAGDLQRVVLAATGRLIPIRSARASDNCVFAVGHKAGCALDLSSKSLGDQGFVLKTVNSGAKTVVIAAGATPQATTYAVYALAEAYGAGFYLGGDALPTKPKPFFVPKLDIARKPALQVRGVLPWYNFFDSPTTWNIEDFQFFIDQLAKSRNNLLDFHTYDREPFAAYRNREGKMTAGDPLLSTATSTWGTVSMKTSEFGLGSGAYFAKEYFGADCSMGYKTPDEGILNAQKLMARAFAYAKARGVRTCLGFEVTGDPTAPGRLDELELQIKHVVKTYPTLDYMCIWEGEGKGVRGWNVPAPRGEFGAYCRRWNEYFQDIKEPRRKSEAARIGIFALAAHRILEREAPQMRLVVSGWGGDKHDHFTDFYPGLDKALPKDVIFSSLDNILTSDTVSDAYGKLSKEREFWPIPWFEYDGDQWFPQPNAKRFFNNSRDSLAKGAKGMLGIHWRSRDVEESHAYISQFAWNTDLSYEDFYREYAARRIGDARAAGLLMALQDSGYRWVGGGGQTEYNTFRWGPAPGGATTKLQELFDSYSGLVHTEGLDWLIATKQWAIDYDKAAFILFDGGEIRVLLNKLSAEKRTPTADEKKLLKDRIVQAEAAFGDAMEAFSRKISTRGELGVLATVNAKAWANLLDVKKAVAAVCGETDLDSGLASASHSDRSLAVNSILRLTTAFAGKPLRISALLHSSSEGTKASVVYRSAGGEFHTTPLKLVNKGRLEGQIPAGAVTEGVLEYYIQATAGPTTATWPMGAPSAVERVAVVPEPVRQKPPVASARTSKPAVHEITGKTGPMLVQIEWQCDSNARQFAVLRQAQGKTEWQKLARTRDTWFEDRSVDAQTSYKYRVLDADSGDKLAESGLIAVPEPPLQAAPALRIIPMPEGVRLWVTGPELVGGFAVYRAEAANGPFTKIKPTSVSPIVDGVGICQVPAEPGKTLYYQVRGLSPHGQEGAASKPQAAAAYSSLSSSAVAAFNFDGTDQVDEANRIVVDGIAALDTRGGQSLRLPSLNQYNTGDELTVEFRVKLLSPGDKPTFVCHGALRNDGFFVQQENGKLALVIPDVGSLSAGSVTVGKWTHVVATYDGATMAMYVDGRKVGSMPAVGSITASGRPFYVGRYEMNEKAYEVDGYIAGVRLYAYALSQADVEARYKSLSK